MAVTALSPLLHGQEPDDNSDTEGSSSCEREAAVVEHSIVCGSSADCTEVINTPLRRRNAGSDINAGSRLSLRTQRRLLMQKRISQSYPHQLSPEALLLLSEASFIAETDDHAVTPLHTQMQSLRELLPLQSPKVLAKDEGSSSCVITRALDYLDHLNGELKCLHKAIHQRQTSCSNSALDSNGWLLKVEHVKDSSLHIRVECTQRKGLLSSLLIAIENLGLVIDRMDVSCNHLLTLDLIATKVEQKGLDGKFVEQVLQRFAKPLVP